jgi:hypothetical protein
MTVSEFKDFYNPDHQKYGFSAYDFEAEQTSPSDEKEETTPELNRHEVRPAPFKNFFKKLHKR